MKKTLWIFAIVLIAVSAFAGGATCDRGAGKAVKLTGTVECASGDCARAQLVSGADQKYTICDKSKVKLASLNGAKVRVSGKFVNCNEGGEKELVVDSLSKI